MAIVFAIATVILYSASIKELDRDTARYLGTNSVANVQATVFCAATAIMCVINAVGAIIISALEKQTQLSIAKTENTVEDVVNKATAPEKDNAREERILSEGGWKCPNCGTLNQNYVTSCGCGMSKYDAKNKQA